MVAIKFKKDKRYKQLKIKMFTLRTYGHIAMRTFGHIAVRTFGHIAVRKFLRIVKLMIQANGAWAFIKSQ